MIRRLIRALPKRLYYGSHPPDGEMCVMEAVAWVAGEPWTDRPACACPVISQFARSLNDRMDDAARQRLLAYVPRIVGTRSTPTVELRRAFRCTDWAVRRFAPLALQAAGLEDQARALQELTPVVDMEAARAAAEAATGAARAARAAGAAGDAVGAAAWDARDAAWAATRAAGDAVGAAAWDAMEATGAARAARAAWAAGDAVGAAGDAVGAAGAAWAATRAAGDAAWDLALLCLDDLLSITEAAS